MSSLNARTRIASSASPASVADLVEAAVVGAFGGRCVRGQPVRLAAALAADLRAERLRLAVAEDLRPGRGLRDLDVRHVDRRDGARSRLQQFAAAKDHEKQQRDGGVDEEARSEGRHGRERQAGLGDDAVGDAAVDRDRGEAAGLRAMDHHEAHQQRRDLVAEGEAEGDRGDDGDGARAHRADRGQQRRDQEHDPWDRGEAALHGANREADQPVDGAVVLRQREEPGNADERQEQASGEAVDDLGGLLAGKERADEEGADEGKHAHVDGPERRDDEHGDQGVDRDQLRCHPGFPPRLSFGAPGDAGSWEGLAATLPSIRHARPYTLNLPCCI